MRWTAAQHQQALEEAKQAAEKWDIEALRQWSREYTYKNYERIEGAIIKSFGMCVDNYTDLLVSKMQEFDNSFYTPVFIKEYQRLGGF